MRMKIVSCVAVAALMTGCGGSSGDGGSSNSAGSSNSGPQGAGGTQVGGSGQARSGSQRDAQLVGTWVTTDGGFSDTAGLGGMGVYEQFILRFNADGSFFYTPANAVDASMQAAGVWSTSNGAIYAQLPEGSGPLGAYYIEGDAMMLTYTDGSRGVWYKQ